MFISCLTIFGCLTIAIFETYLTTTIFDTKQPSLTAKITENEGLAPVNAMLVAERGVEPPGLDKFSAENLPSVTSRL